MPNRLPSDSTQGKQKPKTPAVTPTIPPCPECHGHEVRWRRRTQDWACNRCSATWQNKKEVK